MGLKRPWPQFLACLLGAVCLLCARQAAAQEGPDAFIIKIGGVITQAYSKAVQRKMAYALEQGVDTVIVELDTPGGTIQDSTELADFIFRQEELRVIAYVHSQAFSGGTMVALACDEIYIDASVGRIGDVAPVLPTGEILGEKIQTVVRETMLGYARARGYPESLVKAMVTKEIEVYRVQMQDEPEGHYTYVTSDDLRTWTEEKLDRIIRKDLIVPAGQLLTMHADKAVEYGFARKAVRSPQELMDVLGLDARRVERLYLTGSERLLTFLDAFSPFLIVGGFVLIFMELSHPGFGLPGILGVACFVAFFLIKYTLHYARMLEVLLFVAGLILLVLELFVIPGFGVAGITGIALLFISLVLAFQEFGIPRTSGETLAFHWNLLKVMGSFAATGVSLVVLARFLPSVPGLGAIVHRADLAAARVGDIGEMHTPGLSGMAGREGIALTPLHPAGRAEFGERILDVLTEGDFIEKGARVRIREVRGNTVVVEPQRQASANGRQGRSE